MSLPERSCPSTSLKIETIEMEDMNNCTAVPSDFLRQKRSLLDIAMTLAGVRDCPEFHTAAETDVNLKSDDAASQEGNHPNVKAEVDYYADNEESLSSFNLLGLSSDGLFNHVNRNVAQCIRQDTASPIGALSPVSSITSTGDSVTSSCSSSCGSTSPMSSAPSPISSAPSPMSGASTPTSACVDLHVYDYEDCAFEDFKIEASPEDRLDLVNLESIHSVTNIFGTTH